MGRAGGASWPVNYPGQCGDCRIEAPAPGRESYNAGMTPTVDGASRAAIFPPPQLVAASSVRRELLKGESLYLVGDPGETVYRVDEGVLKLTLEAPGGRERILALAGPGDVLGAFGGPAAAFGESAQALSNRASVRVLPRARLVAEAPVEMLEAAATRMESLRLALEQSELPVAARLARTLLRLGCRFGQRGTDGRIRLTLPITHDHLAAMVGAARETTSTALGGIRAAGAIEGTRGRYSFDPSRLEQLATDAELD